MPGHQVVFLIHQNYVQNTTEIDGKRWKADIHNAVCKLLLHFQSSTAQALNWNLKTGRVENENEQFKWGYKFVKTGGIRFHNLCDFKKLTYENLDLFKQEVDYDDEEEIDYSAHTLAENLITLAHDFHWDQQEIVSPVKPLRKRCSRDNDQIRKRRSNGKYQVGFADNSTGRNFVFIVGPVPTTKHQLSEYFGWNVDTVTEATRILMPSHLSQHFREKHDIQLFWLDTNKKNTVDGSQDDNTTGLSVIEEFLQNNCGCVVPVSYLNETLSISKQDFDDKESTVNINHHKPENHFFKSVFPTSFKFHHLRSKTKVKHDTVASFTIPGQSTTVIAWCVPYFTSNTPCGQGSSMQKEILSENQSNTTEQPNKLNSLELVTTEDGLVSLKCHHKFQILEEHNSSERHFRITGQLLTSFVPYTKLTGQGLMCIFHEPIISFNDTTHTVYALRETCQLCTNESTCVCNNFHKHGLLQVLSRNTATVSWIRESQQASVFNLVHQSVKQDNSTDDVINLADDVINPTDDVIKNPINDVMKLIRSNLSAITTSEVHETDKESEADNIKNEVIAEAFAPSMLEVWYERSSKSDHFKAFSSNMRSRKTVDSEDQHFRNSILSNLQEIYKFNTHDDKEQLSGISKSVKKSICNTLQDVCDAMLFEYKLFQDNHPTSNEQCMKYAKTIIQLLKGYCDKQDIPADSEDVGKILKKIFIPASNIRRKDVGADEKTAECELQLLLRLEWLSYKSLKSGCNPGDEATEEITQLLRAISISQGVERMATFLQESIVENYAKTCGRLLNEVHGDLMLRIPEVLEEYSVDMSIDESFYGPLSNTGSIKAPSTGPFSAQSSVNSQCSNDSRRNKKNFRPRRVSHMNQITTRQIVIPDLHKSKDTKWSRTKSVEILRSKSTSTIPSTKNFSQTHKVEEKQIEVKPVQEQGVSQEIVRVRRDLFASPSKSARKKSNISLVQRKENKSNKGVVRKAAEERRLRRTSVIDTPIAKQRLTALARQSLRMRKSFEGSNPTSGEMVVEESPMKEDEPDHGVAHNLKLNRSPRHSIMLTRRHSFYRDDAGFKSRTVARAEIVHQHNEAAPPTPSVSRLKNSTSDAAPIVPFSPASLLFKYTSSGQRKMERKCVTEQPQRTRRRLQLVPTTLEAEDLKPIAKNLFATNLSPEKPSIPTTISSASISDLISSPLVIKNHKQPSKVVDATTDHTTTPAIPTPFAAYQENTIDEVFSSPVKLPPQKTPQKEQIPCVQNLPSFSEALTPPNKRIQRRSSRISQNVSPTPTKMTGPIDSFVIRTPTSCKKPQSRCPPPPSLLKRKPSPIGDHIQKWPRKKRLNSSPNNPSKRIRKEKLEKIFDFDLDSSQILPSNKEFSNTTEIQHTPVKSPIDSPDGVYIISGNDNQQMIRRFPMNPVSNVDQNEHLNHPNPSPCKRAVTRRTPSKFLTNYEDIGVRPFGELPLSTRRMSPRKRLGSTLFHAKIGSPSSSKCIPMMLLHDDVDSS
ncbi:uncharacterized protein LOC100178337 [Ciona intestinalis]